MFRFNSYVLVYLSILESEHFSAALCDLFNNTACYFTHYVVMRIVHFECYICVLIDTMEEKRNIGSYKNSQNTGKVKRDASAYESETYDFPDEIDTQAYQTAPYNYNDLNELYSFYGMPDISNEKRFLGKWHRKIK